MQMCIANFAVIGCGDMSPPEGAWMTRDGDVIEIGCHSGSKTWTLRCDDNKWIGVLGYCGHHTENDIPAGPEHDVTKRGSGRVWSVSPSEYFIVTDHVLYKSCAMYEYEWSPKPSHIYLRSMLKLY